MTEYLHTYTSRLAFLHLLQFPYFLLPTSFIPPFLLSSLLLFPSPSLFPSFSYLEPSLFSLSI